MKESQMKKVKCQHCEGEHVEGQQCPFDPEYIAYCKKFNLLPPKYYEHEKLKACQHDSQIIHEFLLEFLDSRGIGLAQYVKEGSDTITWVRSDVTRLVAEFLGVDLERLETEKLAMLRAQRKLNEGG